MESGWRAVVTCEVCGFRHHLERVLEPVPQWFPLLCHDCEARLGVDIGAADLARAQAHGHVVGQPR